MVQQRGRLVAPTGNAASTPPNGPVVGLTGFAVLAVVATNLGLPLPGGYLAVDILFVTTGFSLARRVRRARPDPHWLKHFWLAIAARVGAPVLLAVGLIAAYAGWRTGLDEPQLRAILGAVTMTLNFFVISGGAGFMAIEHLWVVAVIMQFSLVVPFLVTAGQRYFGPDRRLSAIVGLAGGVAICRLGFLVSEAAGHESIAANTLTRVDGLLVGLAIGIAPVATLRRRVPVQSAAPAFAALLLLLLVAPDVDEFPMLGLGLLVGVVVLLTGVVVAAEATGAHRGALSATLDNQLMQWLGARAMSLYIWHHVFGVALEIEGLGPTTRLGDWPGAAAFIIRITFSLAAAATSHRYLELPAMAAADQIAERAADDGIGMRSRPLAAPTIDHLAEPAIDHLAEPVIDQLADLRGAAS